MAAKAVKAIDIFRNGLCGVCGIMEINQFFSLTNSYIGYAGIFLPLREILSETLDFKVDNETAKLMEVCLDCKDRIVKIYHFKKKVSEVQKNQRKVKTLKRHDEAKKADKCNKVVQNIYQIIENYTQKCSVTGIRVDEESKKLIIESSDSSTIKKSTTIKINENKKPTPSTSKNVQTPAAIIKEEPPELIDNITFNELGMEDYTDDDDQQTEEPDEDDSDTWRLADFKKKTIKRKSNTPAQPSSSSAIKKARIIKCRSNASTADFKKLQSYNKSSKYNIPISNEEELNVFAKELTEDDEYAHKLGMETVRIVNERYDGAIEGNSKVIRAMIKLLLTEDVYMNMNMTGKVTKVRQDFISSNIKPIKTPHDLMTFLAKYASVLTGIDESKSFKDVRRVITRWISDTIRDRNRSVRTYFENEMEANMEVINQPDEESDDDNYFADPLH